MLAALNAAALTSGMTALQLIHPADVHEFESAAGAFLAAREAEHNLMLGLCSGIRSGTWRDPFFAVVRGDRVVVAALRTPPHNLVLSMVDDLDALAVVVDDVSARTPDLPGVVGPKDAAQRFAELWRSRTGRDFRLKMAERVFRLTRVIGPRPVAGSLRRATGDDRALVIEWLEAMGPD